MCANVRRPAKLTLLVIDLQNILEEHMHDLWIDDDYVCGYWTDTEFLPDGVEIELDSSVTDVEVDGLNVDYIITFKVVNKHDNDELLDETTLERLRETFNQIENLKFRYRISMYKSVYYGVR
mgnify:CR=1 FL=1